MKKLLTVVSILCVFPFSTSALAQARASQAPARRARQGAGGQHLFQLSQRRHHYSGRWLQHGTAVA